MIRTPCTKVCAVDRPSGWCVGCGRTMAEITAWREIGPLRRWWVMTRLARRLRRLAERER